MRIVESKKTKDRSLWLLKAAFDFRLSTINPQIMAIYTKTGDRGETSLASGKRVAKTDVRIEAYGTVDELNSTIGWLRAGMVQNAAMQAADEQLRWVQNKLFNLGAELSEAPGEWIKAEDTARLEEWIDRIQETVPPMRAFVLPAGGETVCRCHICRTVCRRAERKMIEAQSGDEGLRFVNRLSDYLFVLSRYISHLSGETEERWTQE